MESPSTPSFNDCTYTSCYCEENIYWLVKRFLNSSEGEQKWDVFSVFISNPTRTVALWGQRMCSAEDTAIIWDYHVVCALRPRVPSQPSGCHPANERGTWIYDLDTHLPVPCHWRVYVEETFPLGTDIPGQYQRVIPADVYLDNFASDRSHMLSTKLDVSLSDASEELRYSSTPPSYPAIYGPEAEKRGIAHNLMTHFVSMSESGEGFGTVMDLDAFTKRCSLSS